MVAAPDAVGEDVSPKAAALRSSVDSAFAVILLIVPLVLRLVRAFAPVVDPDVWWHLAAGRWMVEHGEVPSIDPFMTGRVASHDWLNYSWLAEVLLWKGYAVAGLAAPVAYSVCMAGLLLLVCAALVKRGGSHLVRRAFVGAIGFLSISTQFGPRTYLFTALFTGVVLLYIRACLRGADPRRGFWLVPMFAVWPNVHIEFLYALFFLGLAAFDRWLDRAKEEPRPSWKPMALVTIACFAATVLNPFGVRLHAMMMRMVGPYTANDIVSEMQANDFRSLVDYLMLLLFGAAIFTLARRRSSSIYAWGALAASAYMGFHSQRISWLVSLVALDIVGDLPLLSREGETGPPRAFRLGLPIAVAATVAICSAALVRGRDDLIPRTIFPYGATAFVREKRLPGPLYNDWNWGGFFRFELPEIRGNIDGRGPIFGNEIPLAAANTWRGKPEWKNDADLAEAGLVIANVRSALTELLRHDPRFEKTYEDELAAVFVKGAR
jgi:hypothetical protein